jgi:hypothetical protein
MKMAERSAKPDFQSISSGISDKLSMTNIRTAERAVLEKGCPRQVVNYFLI